MGLAVSVNHINTLAGENGKEYPISPLCEKDKPGYDAVKKLDR